jgi:hypothetical protein
VLCLLLAFVVLPPFVAQATGTVVGSYTMFNRLERYHIELYKLTRGGEERVSVRSVASHLSPQAKPILLPADGYSVGADQIDLTIAGLPDLARLLCKLDPKATAARVTLTRDPFDPSEGVVREASATCEAR